jgi:hypothetical protein
LRQAAETEDQAILHIVFGEVIRRCRALLVYAGIWVLALSISTVTLAQSPRSPSDTVKSMKGATAAGEFALECTDLVAKHRNALEVASWAKDLSKGLGYLGTALDAAAVSVKLANKDYWGGADEVTHIVIETAACATSCPGWFVGQTLGTIIDQIPVRIAKETGSKDLRTVNERWTDALAGVYGEIAADRGIQEALRQQFDSGQIFMNREEGERYAKILEIERGLNEGQRVVAKLKQQTDAEAHRAQEQARREFAAASSRRCDLPSKDPLQAGVDALSGKANESASRRPAPPLRSTPPATNCDMLKDTRASERLATEDPDAYDALMARCL